MLKKNYALAENVSKVGYVPYQGITQAALTPQMEAGMRGIDTAAQAFGLPNAGGDLGLPAPITNAAGFSGYSPYAQYQHEIAQIPQGQRDAINSFVIDPMTGMLGGQAWGSGYGGGQTAQNTYGTPEYFAHQNDTTRTDANYLNWKAAQQGGGGYGRGYGYQGGGELAGNPGSLGVPGVPGSMGAFGDALGSIGSSIGDAFGAAGFGEAFGAGGDFGGAQAADAAGFGGGDFGGF